MEELDHVVPLSEGGTHHPDNIRARCKTCHRFKHQGLVDPDDEGRVVRPGTPDRSGHADRAFQAIRSRTSLRKLAPRSREGCQGTDQADEQAI